MTSATDLRRPHASSTRSAQSTLPTLPTLPAQSIPSIPSTPSVLLLLGGYTLAIQIILVREGFALLAGNELSLALQLGLWLVLTAAGGLLGTVLPGSVTAVLLLCLPLTGVSGLVLIRLGPLWLPTGSGEMIPLGWAVLVLAAAQLPLNLIAGALFPCACTWVAAERSQRSRSDIGWCYMIETLGAALAGIVMTGLAGRLSGLDLAVWLSALAAVVSAVVLYRCSRWTAYGAGALAVILAGTGALAAPAQRVDELWWRSSHPGSRRLATIESPYQRIDVGLCHGQHTIYCNGLPAVTLEDQEEPSSGYRLADLYLSLHPEPRTVLVIGNGEPGLLRRLLEHPLDQVIYVLADTRMLDAVQLAAGQAELWQNPRLTLVEDDGRRFLNRNRYQSAIDLVLIDLPAPVSAGGNRFFTTEAYTAARRQLRAGGLLVLRLPSSSHYLGGETSLLLASVRRALSQAFTRVELLAGDSMILVAGADPGSLATDVERLAERFAGRGVPVRLAGSTVHEPARKAAVFAALFAPQLDQQRRLEQQTLLDQTKIIANSDRAPLAYYLNLRRWLPEIGLGPSALAATVSACESLIGLGRRFWPLATGLVAVVLAALPSLFRHSSRPLLAAAVLSSGCAGMLGELAIIYTFQSSAGRLYQVVGALLATYMLGLAAGSRLTIGLQLPRPRQLPALVVIRGLMIGSCILALGLDPDRGSLVTVLPVLLIYALVLGMEYPLANRAYRDRQGSTRATAGILHSMDHLGAAAATLIGGTILLPLLGARTILLAVTCMHIALLLALAWHSRDRGR